MNIGGKKRKNQILTPSETVPSAPYPSYGENTVFLIYVKNWGSMP